MSTLLPIPVEWLPAGLDPRTARLFGADEVGRGSLVGSLVGVACRLPQDLSLPTGLRDSKRLDPKGRLIRQLAAWVIAQGEVLIEEISAAEIDRMGIGRANRLLFERLLERSDADFVLVDGNLRLDSAVPHRCEPKGERFAPVAAASIVAKVYRDSLLRALDEVFPGYALSSSAGYGLPAMRAALAQGRRSPIHRRSFHIRGLDPE